MKQRPVAIGLLVCEQVIIEEGTRNFTPVNCVSRYTVKEIPSVPFPFVVFTTLVDGIGVMPLEIRIQRLDTLEVITRHSARRLSYDPFCFQTRRQRPPWR